MDPALFELIERADPAEEVEVLVKLKHPDHPPPELRVVTRFGDVVTGRVRADQLRTVWASDQCISVKAPRQVREELRALPPTERAEPVHTALQSRRPDVVEDGRGVIIALLDWGFDLAHPNLRHPDSSTRALALWHQGAQRAGDSHNKYGYGAIHSRAAIDEALRSADPYAALDYHPADADTEGDGAHGTHVADIAAGNGSLSGSITGVAPAADLIFIDLSTDAIPGRVDSTLGDSVRVLEALDFVCATAAGRPWVANLSLGAMGGPHDARTLVEQAMDQLLEREVNTAIVCSCGNYYESATHATGQLRPGERFTLGWHIHADDRTPNEVEVWYSGIDQFDVEFIGPQPESRVTAALGESARVTLGDIEVGRLYHRAVEPNTNDNHIDVFLDRSAPAGEWHLDLIGRDVMDGRFDAWIERDGSAHTAQSHFREAEVARERTIGTICTGYRTIAVGAYDANSADRLIAPFSSAGYTRDGRQKPELVAPGMEILAARSAGRDGGAPRVTRKSGTSMAAPHVTGTIALMFQAADRPLKIWETRAILLANVDAAAGQDPRRFGAGYLNSEKAVKAVRSRPTRVEPPVTEQTPAELLVEESVNATSESNPLEFLEIARRVSPPTFYLDRATGQFRLQLAPYPTELQFPAAVTRVRGFEPELETQPLDPSTIRYLAFEGGGGKGFAFLGAVQALEELGILVRRSDDTGLQKPNDGGRIAGISGSSAGAITALLVSAGYSSAQIRQILSNPGTFTRFYDAPRPGSKVYARLGPTAGREPPSGFDRVIAAVTTPLPVQLAQSAGRVLPQLILALMSSQLDPPFDRLTNPDHIGDYLECLRTDFGFFDGWYAREFFDQMLRAALARMSGRPEAGFRNASFTQHFEITGIKLAVAGANLSTRRSEIFSVESTPTMAVADAVRISMGFPFAFKPVIIANPAAQGIAPGGTMTNADLLGYWVDGGLLNNLPMHAFDTSTGTVLGLRLDIDRPNYSITTFGQFVSAFFRTLMNAGESQISSSWRTAQRTIALNTTGLSLFDFDPDPRIAQARIDEARATVLSRFPRGARSAAMIRPARLGPAVRTP